MTREERHHNLEEKLTAMRLDVSRLEDELQRVIEAEQHEMVDSLDDHFEAVDSRFRNLREFLLSFRSV